MFNDDFTALKGAIQALTGYDLSRHFNHVTHRGRLPLTYCYLPGGSILKVHGPIPAASPRTRGAQAWAERKPGRQATINGFSGRLIDTDEAD